MTYAWYADPFSRCSCETLTHTQSTDVHKEFPRGFPTTYTDSLTYTYILSKHAQLKMNKNTFCRLSLLQDGNVSHRIHICLEHRILDLPARRATAAIWQRRYCDIRRYTFRSHHDASPIRGALHGRPAHWPPAGVGRSDRRWPHHGDVTTWLRLGLRRCSTAECFSRSYF